MENQPQQQPTSSMCRAGCGFFGSPANEGLCSKCYKDHIKRKQDTARLSPTVTVPVASSSATAAEAPCSQSPSSTSPVPSPTGEKPQLQSCSQAAHSTEEVTAALESAEAVSEQSGAPLLLPSSTTQLAISTSSSAASLESVASDASATASPDAPPPTKKANRCQMCKKRVGLTGFQCRCGGLYCGEHRYDQAHGCSFDYKTMEREEIRKNNPVIVSEKIQRI